MRSMGRRGAAVGRVRAACATAAVLLVVATACSAAPPAPGSSVAGTGVARSDAGTGLSHSRVGGGPDGAVGPTSTTSCPEPPAGSEVDSVAPSELGMDADAVEAALEYAVAKGSQSIRVYRHGCLVGTGSNDAAVDWVPLPAWSMTKGVVSMLVGRAVELGRLGVDDPIGRYLDVADPRKAALTVREFLNQTTGLRLAWASDLNEAATTDSAAALLQRQFEAVPGTTFNYAQTSVTLLVAVVEAAVGEDLQDFAQRELFGPIGIERSEWQWERDGAGRSQGFAFLQMTPPSFGRLGRLLLQDGVWSGRRLLPSDYIAQGRAGTAANPCYGFLWRNNDGVGCGQTGPVLGLETTTNWMPTVPTDAYALAGMFDQLVLVIPSLDMVVVRMGLPHQVLADPLGDVQGERPSMTWRFFRTLLAGVTDVAVPDPGDWVPRPPDQIDWLHILEVPVPEPTW